MRSALRNHVFVCLDCRLRQSQNVSRRFQSSLAEVQTFPQPIDLSAGLLSGVSKSIKQSRAASAHKPKSKARLPKTTQSPDEAPPVTQDAQAATGSPTEAAVLGEGGALSLPEKFYLRAIERLRQRLEAGIASIKSSEAVVRGLSFEDAVKATNLADRQGLDKDVFNAFKITFTGQNMSKVMEDTKHVQAQRYLQRGLLRTLGIGPDRLVFTSNKIRSSLPGRRKRGIVTPRSVSRTIRPRRFPRRVTDHKSPEMARIFKNVLPKKSAPSVVEDVESNGPSQGPKRTRRAVSKLDSTKIRSLRETDVGMEPLAMDEPVVPRLSFDLTRVLFNPGVYQLQDPRSRVFNFSPYLQRILPVSEFNFDALNEYITSSRDSSLRDLGLKHRKKYLGSSSSMTGVLAHFHFLLSAWRPINVKTLSQSFTDPLRTFTMYQRGPSAIFLRWQDGIYAVDADKEYDSANILMSLGKSMEKLLTLEEEEFERYRKSAPEQGTAPPRPEPEAYHYTESGDFLLRSQLDAHDPRLPGTGMFDLKTRAVVSIRMNVRDHEMGMGYEIQNRFGDMESYEKEYFDMIRSAFLKYSLQVRMGRMDGIFVAYHNIERIFGFQYISLPEMDLHLHGTEHRATGDTEFKLSLGLLNKIFNKVTSKMSQTSVRFHFETRDSTAAEGGYMYIFAEAQTEQDIENIQNSKKAEIAEFEARIFNTSRYDEKASQAKLKTNSHLVLSDGSVEEVAAEIEPPDSAEIKAKANAKSEKFSQPPVDKLMGFILRARNKVNGKLELRPVDLDDSDSWDVEYTLEDLPHDRAVSLYSQCRARRARQQKLTQKEDVAADYYLRKMKRLAENGRHVRKNIDRNDAGRPIVVLDRVQ